MVDLVKKAKKGNAKAFQELIQLEKARLYRMAYLYVKNENDALDVVQEAVYKAYVSIDKLKHPHYFSTWITRILIHAALDFIRKHEKMTLKDDLDDVAKEQDLGIEDRMDLVRAIERLDVPYKTVIILRYYKDLTVKQIAELLECPEGTVKVRLHRAISYLKTEMKKGCV
jgi:RNA polymerase sigma-70 factor, ECF subfamily